MKSAGGKGFLAVYGTVKVVVMIAGAIVTVLGLMSVVGIVTDIFWVRLVAGIVVAMVVPLVLADRLVPEDPAKGKGIVTDALATTWLVAATAFVLVGGPLLHAEAARHDAQDRESWAAVVRALAGPAADSAAPTTSTPAGSGAAGTAAAGGPETGAPGSGAASAAAGAPASAPSTAMVGGSGSPSTAVVPAKDATPADLFRSYAPAVVTVAVAGGGGTGFLIDTNGTLVTNHHVIDSALERRGGGGGFGGVRIKLYDGTWVDDVELLVDDDERDLALLRIKTTAPLKIAVLGDSDKVTVGERVVSIGNPLGLEHTLTDGLVSARRVVDGKPFIQMSAAVAPGNSGGPLFNMRGEVIGITTSQMVYGGSLNMAVPVNFLKKMIKTDYPDRKPIGSGSGGGTW